MWGTEDKPAILPKTKGSGIMVSDFVEEYGGFLRLSDVELALVRKCDSDFPSEAREIFEYYGTEKGG